MIAKKDIKKGLKFTTGKDYNQISIIEKDCILIIKDVANILVGAATDSQNKYYAIEKAWLIKNGEYYPRRSPKKSKSSRLADLIL